MLDICHIAFIYQGNISSGFLVPWVFGFRCLIWFNLEYINTQYRKKYLKSLLVVSWRALILFEFGKKISNYKGACCN